MTIVAPAAVVMPFFFGSKANFTGETHNYRMWHLCNHTKIKNFQNLLSKMPFSLPTK